MKAGFPIVEMNETGKSAWADYRKKARKSWKLHTVSIPVSIYILINTDRFSPRIAFPLWITLAVIDLVVTWPVQFFRCPQCHKHFFLRHFHRNWNPFPQKCVHCGLRKWAEPSPKSPESEIHQIPRTTSSRPAPKIAELLRFEKFLTLVLRDDPGAIDLRLDQDGWADVDQLVDGANHYGIKLTRRKLVEITTASGAGKFESDPSSNRIRFGSP